MNKKVIFCSLLGVLVTANATYAQLENTFKQVFDFFLKKEIQLSGSFHGPHYLPAAAQADSLLRPALNSLIATNVSSFPLSSTIAGVTFDFSTGRPMSITESLGPIFAETAATLGRGRVNHGFNFTHLNLSRLRGLSTKDIRFTFIHDDLNDPRFPSPPSLGDPQFENDVIDLFLDLDVNANIFALFATLGVTNALDIGVAIPIINVSLNGDARAVITSFTYGRPGQPIFEGAAHRFGGTLLNPILEAEKHYNGSAMGLGDIALRVKYGFLRGAVVDLAALLDIRLPTGDEKEFLGTGKTNARFSWIMSKKIGNFSPHLNIGYDRRLADFDSDELEFTAGFDQKIAPGVTFAVEFLGAYDLNDDKAIKLFPGTTTVFDEFTNTLGSGRIERNVDLSNIPERDNDNTFDAAFGFRVAPSERFLFLGNIFVPLNEGGLRSNVAPTLGFTANF